MPFAFLQLGMLLSLLLISASRSLALVLVCRSPLCSVLQTFRAPCTVVSMPGQTLCLSFVGLLCRCFNFDRVSASSLKDFLELVSLTYPASSQVYEDTCVNHFLLKVLFLTSGNEAYVCAFQ